jgi:hypothetical protein
MIRLNFPDGSDEQALEAFLASLNKSARDGVRRMILEGAAEADVAAYIESFEDQIAQEEETIYEENETGEGPAS